MLPEIDLDLEMRHGTIGAPLKTTYRSEATLPSWALPVGGATVVAAAVAAGLTAASGDRSLMLIPVACALGLAALTLAVTRFELFVGLILLVRASLDPLDVGSSTLDAAGALSVLFVGASILWLLAERVDAVHAVRSSTQALLPPVAAFFGAATLSVTFSTHPLESLFEVVRFGTLIVIVVVLGRLITNERRMRLVLIAAIGSSIFPLLVAFNQLMTGGGFLTPEGLGRIRGTFLHSNPFAAYLFLMITLIVSLYPHVTRWWKLMLTGLGVACGGALLMTYARGSWVATILALVVVGILQDRRILWLLGATLVVIALAVPSVGVRLSDLSETQKASGAPGNSLQWRIQYWKQVLTLQDNPVLGIGFKEVELTETAAKAPHNDPIRVYVETGVIGLAAYVWFLVALGVEARTSLRRAPPGIPRGLAVAFAASLTGFVGLSLTANVITQLVILWYFITIVALSMGTRASGEATTA
jgi:putative inorganic carbon (HCO3(-)) transporter